jgi:rod shape-determining protein MreD
MNRVGVILLAWVCLALDVGLAKPVFELGTMQVSPSFVFILVVYVAMCAPPRAAAWTALLLGLLVDLTSEWTLTTPGGRVFVPGPHALAYLLGAQAVFPLRAMVIRRNPLTLGFLTVCAGVVAQAALAGTLLIRRLYDPLSLDATHALLSGLGSSLYSAVLAVPLALVLLPMAPLLGLPSQQHRRFGRP